MELPASVTALGEQLRGAGEIVPDPALFSDAHVFAAERERIFLLPWTGVDHVTRLAEDGHYFRCDAGARSLVLTRDGGGQIHALRNVCIHAGYPVCDAEEGPAERLVCLYHGWEYALDGELLEPAFAGRVDRSRLRMARYPVSVRNGLIFVDLSGKEATEEYADAVPSWLAGAVVVRRARYNTTWNWKFLRHFLQSSPHLFVDGTPDSRIEFGPLSFVLVQARRAVLIRIIPRFSEQTDFQVIVMGGADAAAAIGAAEEIDPVAEGLRCADGSLAWFDRRFADWYWPLMSTGA
jgi:nitrite reductase/ring-hydroxylating ferredoxin subunit